jgi:Restriction endonuclease
MPRRPLTRSFVCHPASAPPRPWEPALTQLRELAPADLDALVCPWLAALGLSSVQVRERRPNMTTYQAVLGASPLGTPLQIRVYQRTNRLQVHHVEAFVGHLTRLGIPSGLLLTTGDCTRDAVLVAGAVRAPRVGLLSGDRWAKELAASRSGLRRRSLRQWIVDLNTVLGRSRRPGPPRTERHP